MENVKESLEKFKDWYNNFHKNDSIELISSLEIEMFLNSRPREPEAINRNEQAKELCVHYDGCDGGQKSKCGKYSVKDCYEKAQ